MTEELDKSRHELADLREQLGNLSRLYAHERRRLEDEKDRLAAELERTVGEINRAFLIRLGRAIPAPIRVLVRRLLWWPWWVLSGRLPEILRARRQRSDAGR